MKKFKSHLNTLVKIKNENEDAAKKKLITLFLQLQEIKKKKQNLEQEILQLSPHDDEKFSVENAQATASYIEQVQIQIEQISKLIVNKEHQVDQARLEMIETMKQKKVIENIENKEKDMWKKKGEKQEEQHYDEISTTRFLKKKLFLKQQLKSHDEKNKENS